MYCKWNVKNIKWVAKDFTEEYLKKNNITYLYDPEIVLTDSEIPAEMDVTCKEDYIAWEMYDRTGRYPYEYDYRPDPFC